MRVKKLVNHCRSPKLKYICFVPLRWLFHYGWMHVSFVMLLLYPSIVDAELV